ncbi:MAG: hypothetical protein KF795_00515 [Labilithrix sp.]|nr:hypothetical protein [Labilithrix sp.]
MGRPYAKELAELDATYAWAATAEIPKLQRAVMRSATSPLIAVGSGGALTSANVMVQLHRRFAGALALTTTPLHLRTAIPSDHRAAVWLLSAGGRNQDIRSALRAAVEREPRQVAIFCGAPESPLMHEAADRPWVDRIGADLPNGDGFLATNSVLAFSVLLARAYLDLVGKRLEHQDLGGLLTATHAEHETLAERSAPFWGRPTTIVLHGATTAPAAHDLESRFTEAALGLVQLADFRNFAHGRHHWLAKHPETSAVLAFVGPEDQALAHATLRLLPPKVPTLPLHFSGELPEVLLGSIVMAMRVAASAGLSRGIDPGRPGVPEFGSRLYHMKTPRPRALLEDDGLSPVDETAIARKARATAPLLRARDAFEVWKSALVSAKARLADVLYGGLVCDYDGTLVESLHRDMPPEPPVVEQLVRLLHGGVFLGIATGRGDSITAALRDVLPESTWSSVIVGYHNGATVQSLDEEPNLASGEPTSSLKRSADVLAEDPFLRARARVRTAADQITVSASASSYVSEEDLWLVVSDTLRRERLDDVRVVRSSHSVDVIPTTSSKLRVVDEVQRRISPDRKVLALGDRGCWPGNDHELLAITYALSVDEVSPDPATGWNLCPIGQRGIGGALHYLSAMDVRNGGFRLSLGRDNR